MKYRDSLICGIDAITGKAKSIDEVERGISCNCICSYCKRPLEACKGEIIIPYFRHYTEKGKKDNNFVGDSINCYESSIHLMAKKIIEKEKIIVLPNGKSYKVVNVEVEKRIDVDEKYFIADLSLDVEIFENKIHKLLVEIFVTHKVDNDKKQLIKKSQISAVEVDLSECEFFESMDSLKKELMNSKNIKFLYNDAEYKKNLRIIEAVKKIIVSNKCIKLPSGNFYNIDSFDFENVIKRSFDEYNFIAKTKNSSLAIFISTKKRLCSELKDRIKALNQSAIEIDLTECNSDKESEILNFLNRNDIAHWIYKNNDANKKFALEHGRCIACNEYETIWCKAINDFILQHYCLEICDYGCGVPCESEIEEIKCVYGMYPNKIYFSEKQLKWMRDKWVKLAKENYAKRSN